MITNKRVDDFFIKAIQALLKGFEPVVVDAKDLMDKLTKLPPMDEVGFKQKLNELMMSLCHLKIVNFLKIYSITLGNEG